MSKFSMKIEMAFVMGYSRRGLHFISIHYTATHYTGIMKQLIFSTTQETKSQIDICTQLPPWTELDSWYLSRKWDPRWQK